jgi:3-hydroxy acid dehydrogenase/malonic semialdehyde reductase
LSKSLRAIHAGMVNTEFSKIRFKGDQNKIDKVYEGIKSLIAKIILFMVCLPEHITIADLTILPTAQANSKIINRKYELSLTILA